MTSSYIAPVPIIQMPDLSLYKGEHKSIQAAALDYIKSADFEAAIAQYEILLGGQDKDLPTVNILAALYVHLQQNEAAISWLRRVLKKAPDDIVALNNMAVCYLKQEKFSMAEKYLMKAAKSASHIPEINHNCGVLYQGLESYPDALQAFMRAFQSKKMPETLLALGFINIKTGDLNSAEIFANLAKEAQPSSPVVFYLLSQVYLGKNQFQDAFDCAAECLNRAPDQVAYIHNFVNIVTFSSQNAVSVGHSHYQAVVHVLRYENVDHQALSALWMLLFKADQQSVPLYALLSDTELELDLEHFLDILPALENEFFWRGVKQIPVISQAFENLLCVLRRCFLLFRDEAELPDDMLYALAERSFMDEYIWAVSEKEEEALETLVSELKEDDLKEDAFEAFLLIGSYRPVYGSAVQERVMQYADNFKDDRFQAFVRYQIKEPVKEREIAKSIKTFGTIENKVSLEVKTQYEENPYPRWNHGATFNDKKKNEKQKKRPVRRILIAGCGTGRQVFSAASQYKDLAKITAIDLSAASLAYAARKTQDAGIKNVRYYMGDLLELSALRQSYDEIHCTGVLHHMEDPAAGWRVLTACLADHGRMKIALYSELARQPIVMARAYIKQQGIPADTLGIKQMRDYIKGLPDAHPMKKITQYNDFYLTSMCRDLLFHVQEHRFTIPQIKETLAQLGLVFDGFLFPNAKPVQDFKIQYPENKDLLDLDKWHAFEKVNPDTFWAMYTFMCHKK